MLNIGAMTWSNASNTNLLPALHQLNEPVMLFAKVDPELLKFQLNKLAEIKKEIEAREKTEAEKKAKIETEKKQRLTQTKFQKRKKCYHKKLLRRLMNSIR